MLYLIGLGPDLCSISLEALEVCKKCKIIYLEDYTAKIPYSQEELESLLKKNIRRLKREEVEEESFLEEAKTRDIALLVYGSPLAATTHISLILKCKKESIPFKVIHNAGILNVIAETGLQIYKFGKTASMPQWTSSYKPSSFLEIIKENQSINAHTILLVDIGLSFKEALQQLESAIKSIKLEKIIICSLLGTNKQKILYNSTENLKKIKEDIEEPFCFIIPGKLHFLEEEMLTYFS